MPKSYLYGILSLLNYIYIYYYSIFMWIIKNKFTLK